MMRILELFSGIGGMRAAAKEALLEFDIIATYEINPSALSVYSANFSEKSKIQPRNIMSFTTQDLECLLPDMIMMSPPCQPFTRQGLKQDTNDKRCEPFVHILSVFELSKFMPQKILVENVVGFEDSTAHNLLTSVLKKRNYMFQEFLLSPKQFGIPNSRKRYYLLATTTNAFKLSLSIKIHTEFPICLCWQTPREGTSIEAACRLCEKPFLEKTINLLKNLNLRFDPNCLKSDIDSCPPLKIAHFLDDLEDDSPYLVRREQLIKYATVFDIVNSDSEGSCCFTSGYGRFVQGTGSLLHQNTLVDLDSTYEQIASLDSINPLYYESLCTLKLRYFTPDEILRLLCFPEDFVIPKGISVRQAYKLLGNSINVFVVSALLTLIT